MVNWGYTITRGRRVDIDSNDMSYSRKLLAEFPELQSCIACGSCTATCTAGNLTKFNVRKLQTLVRRGRVCGSQKRVGKVYVVRGSAGWYVRGESTSGAWCRSSKKSFL